MLTSVSDLFRYYHLNAALQKVVTSAMRPAVVAAGAKAMSTSTSASAPLPKAAVAMESKTSSVVVPAYQAGAISAIPAREMHAAASTVTADLNASAKAMWTAPAIKSSLQGSLSVIANRYQQLNFAEAFVPGKNGEEFHAQEWFLRGDLNDRYGLIATEAAQRTIKAKDSCSVTQTFRTQKAVELRDTTGHVFPKFVEASAPFNSAVVVPVIAHGEVKAVIRLYSEKDLAFSAQDFADLEYFVGAIVAAGVYGATPANNLLPFKVYNKEIIDGLQKEVYQLVVQHGSFSPQRCYDEVDWFFGMGLAPIYFNRFGAKVVSNHILVYAASKQFSQAAGSPEDLWLAIENNVQLMGGLQPEQSLHMVPNDIRKIVAVERNIIRRIKQIPAGKAFALEMCTSHQPFSTTSKKPLCLYVLQTNDFANPSRVGDETQSNIYDIASTVFNKEKTKLVRDRYQEIVNDAKDHLGPIAKVYPAYRDGTIPLMFAFRYRGHDGPTTNYMLHLTQLLHRHNLSPVRKFIETFSNNLIVFSLYLTPDAPRADISRLMKQFSLLHLVPQNETLTPKFVDGSLAAEEYAYLSAATRVLFYSISQRPDEYNTLSKHFKNDTLNLGRLRSLYQNLRREAVSHQRIMRTMLAYPQLIQKIYQDFEMRNTRTGILPRNAELESEIARTVKFSMDLQILQALLNFNRHVLKTNFFRSHKAAISFRLDPAFFSDMDLPQLPYGVFFVMGAEFQGFHIRFSDVARGGIRMIRSRDEYTYNKNLSSLFQENYNLSYTQNLKNKDIPEFGSKGTILLNPESQTQDKAAFQKYISAMLDLLVLKTDPTSENYIHDNYGKQELLFCGPDEGTAGYMEWAALYAKARNYAYWRAFTTGKPPSLGGIPHDTFGMTTTSVHRVVLGCIEKLGLDETKCTKVQTGGPDGDLGSNEILVSKDKTIAIIDGSGVAYDPAGLNREELIALAKRRVPIENFDKSKLGPGAFIVKVNDSNVVLPNGDVVESGVSFRNDFHLHPLATADLFVPCGGRPESININNVQQLLADGKPRFRVIVEGANLFVTQDARMALEEAGVILYKDASANKGGVTSSSLEVLAALSLPDDVFAKNMAVLSGQVPAFYNEYVKEIKTRIANDAYAEFDCIWREHNRTGLARFLLTDKVSNKINSLNHFVNVSNLWDNAVLRRVVLAEAIPRKLQDLVGLDTILSQAPESYIRAIFCAYLSSRYVYKYGIDANEFAFFEFMEPYTKKAIAIEYGLAGKK